MADGDRVNGVRKRAGAWLLFAGLMVSAAGDEIAVLTMIFRMAEQGHSDLVAALLIAQLAPGILLAPVVGHLIDRHDAGWLLAVASAVQGLVLLPVVLVDHVLVLVIGMFTISTVGSVAMPAVLTLLPIIAGEAVPVRANAVVEGGRALATLGGPLFGGFLIAATGTSIPLVIDAVSYFLVAAVLPLLRVHRPVEASSGRWWSGAGEGLRHLARQRSLRTLMVVLPITTSAISMVNVAMVFMVRGPMHSGAGVLGVVTAAWGAGSVLGAIGISRFALTRPELSVTVGAMVVGVALWAWGTWPLITIGLVAAVLGGIGGAMHNIALRSAVQMYTPPSLHGRAHAAAGAVINSFFLIGFALSGLFALHHAQGVFLAAGMVTTVVAGLATLALLWTGNGTFSTTPGQVDLADADTAE